MNKFVLVSLKTVNLNYVHKNLNFKEIPHIIQRDPKILVHKNSSFSQLLTVTLEKIRL